MHICIQSGLCSGERFRNLSNGPSFSPQSFFRAQLWNSCDRVTGLESASPSALLRESAIMEGLVEVGETDWPRWASTLVQQRQCVHTENTAVAWHVGGGRPSGFDFPSACHLILMHIFDATVLLVLGFYGHISERKINCCVWAGAHKTTAQYWNVALWAPC